MAAAWVAVRRRRLSLSATKLHLSMVGATGLRGVALGVQAHVLERQAERIAGAVALDRVRGTGHDGAGLGRAVDEHGFEVGVVRARGRGIERVDLDRVVEFRHARVLELDVADRAADLAVALDPDAVGAAGLRAVRIDALDPVLVDQQRVHAVRRPAAAAGPAGSAASANAESASSGTRMSRLRDFPRHVVYETSNDVRLPRGFFVHGERTDR